MVQLVDQELRLHLDRVGSTEPLEVREQAQLQLDLLQLDLLHRDLLQLDLLQLEPVELDLLLLDLPDVVVVA